METDIEREQREWEEDLERTGFRRGGGWSLRETSDKVAKMEAEFQKAPKTQKMKAAMDAAVFAMYKSIERDKKRRMSSNIIPFDSIERKRSMSQLAENQKNLVVPGAELKTVATDMSNPFSSLANFEAAQRMAKALSESSLIPKEYQKNIPNCLIALEISQRLRASALMVMQNLYIVHGKPGWSAQYIISAINSCGKFSPLRFKMNEKKTECTAYAVELRTNEVLEGTKITLEMAKQEGWSTKAGSKWITMPEQMLRYRSASFFGKIYAPEILMGFQTTEEIEDSQAYAKAREVKSEIHVQAEIVQQEPEQIESIPEIISEPTPKAPLPAAAELPETELPWEKYRDGYQAVK